MIELETLGDLQGQAQNTRGVKAYLPVKGETQTVSAILAAAHHA